MKASVLVSGDSAGAQAALRATEAALGSAEAEARQLAKAFGEVDVSTSRLASAQTKAKTATEAAKASFAAGEISLEQYNRQLIEVKTRLGLMTSAHNAAVNGLKRSQAAFNDALESTDRAGKTTAAMGESSRLAGHHVQNLAYQINDVVVGLASGQAPMTVFMQQGAQIGQIMAAAGLGVAGLTREVIAMSAAFVAANPIIAAITVAAGLGAATIGVMTAEINANGKATVTWRDTALGAYDTVANYLKGEMATAFEAIGISAEAAWKLTVAVSSKAINLIIGFGTAAPRAIITAFKTLPAAIGDLFFTSTNGAIAAINLLLRTAVQGINSFSAQANRILPAGMQVPQLGAPQLGSISNPFAGGAARAVSAARQDALDGLNRNWTGEWAQMIEANAIRRSLEGKGSDGKGGAGSGTRGAARAAGRDAGIDFAKEFADTIAEFNPQIQQRMKDMVRKTEDDLAELKAQSNAAFEASFAGVRAAAEANVRWNEELRATIGYLSQIGGMGSSLANVGAIMLGLKTGDFSQARGSAGVVAQLFQQAFPDFSTKMVDGFDNVLSKVFGKNGSFTNMLQGAGSGSAMASLLYGGNKSAQVGGAIGGSIGQMVGGPIGNLVGSIIGSTLGKIFGGGAKYGTASIGNGKISTGGNDSGLKGNAGTAAEGIGSALDEIAARLGGSVGGYSVSIGQMDGKWRVSTTGRTGKLENKYKDVTNFGKEGGQQAFSFALSDAIADGAIQGISAAVQRALKSDSNIDKALKEALKVQEVELLAGGIGAEIAKAMNDFERVAAERVRIAREYGFDVIKIEERNAADRLKLTKQLLAEQVGSLQDLIDEMTSGALFEGSAVERRQLLLDQISAAKAAADAGEQGAADRLAELMRDLNTASRDAFGTTGGYAGDRTTILDAARDTIAKANQRIADAQAASDSAVVSALDENNDQNAQMLAALGLTNEYLAQLAAGGWTSNGSLADLARTSAAYA